MTAIETIVAAVSASGALSAALIWITKSWISERLKNSIKHEYDQALETYKAQLKAENDIAIERLKAELHVAATNQTVRFAALHEKRAQAIEKLYSLLDRAFAEARFTVALADRSESDWHGYADAVQQLWKHFHEMELYFGKDLANRVHLLITSISGPQDQHEFVIQLSDSAEDRAKLRAQLIDEWHSIESEVRLTKEAIEEEFRKLLGS